MAEIQIMIRPRTSKTTHIDPVAAHSNSLVGVFTIMGPSFGLNVQVPNVVGNIRLRVSRKYKEA